MIHYFLQATDAFNQAERIVRMSERVFENVNALYNDLEVDFISTGSKLQLSDGAAVLSYLALLVQIFS